MKYSFNAVVYHITFSKILKSYYKIYFPFINLTPFIKNIKKEYKSMLERTPGTGNSLESNLVGACWFFSLAKCVPAMNPELLNKIIEFGFKLDFMQKLHAGQRKKGTIFSDKVQDKKLKEAEKSQTSDLEMDWKFTYEKGKDEFYYTYTKCGVCRLAEREHMEAYLPCMCHMDYSKFEMVGGKLYRTKTIANGDDCCDFHVVKL